MHIYNLTMKGQSAIFSCTVFVW